MALLIILLASAVLFCVVYRRFSWQHLRHLPSPPSLPLLGHLLDMQSKTLHHFTYLSFLKYGPIYTLWWGSRPYVALCNHVLGRKAMQRLNTRSMLPAPFMGDDLSFYNEGLLFANDPLHRVLRAAWVPHFLPASLAKYHEPTMAACQRLLEWLGREAKAGAAFDVHRYCSCMTMEVVGRAAFGIEIDAYQKGVPTAAATAAPPAATAAGMRLSDRETGAQIMAAFRAVFDSAQPKNASAWVALFVMLPEAWGNTLGWLAKALPDRSWRVLMQSHDVLRRVCRQLIHGHAADGVKGPHSNTFLEHILETRTKETGAPLPETSVISNITTFLAAGFETSANTLAYAIYHLAGHPEAEAALVKEIDSFGPGYVPKLDDLDKLPYLTAVIDETMRLTPVASFLFRELLEPFSIGGYDLPEGTRLLISIWSMNRDPEMWRDAEAFVPERFMPGNSEWTAPEGAFFPFGGGQRMCIGWKFAYQELKLALFTVYQRFTFRLSPADFKLQLSTGITTGPDHGIMVTAHNRSDAPVRPEVHARA